MESKLIEISDSNWSACITRNNRYSVYIGRLSFKGLTKFISRQ